MRVRHIEGPIVYQVGVELVHHHVIVDVDAGQPAVRLLFDSVDVTITEEAAKKLRNRLNAVLSMIKKAETWD